MIATMLLKIFSDCCICFAILGSGPVVFEIPLLLPAMLCGISAGIAAFFDGKYLTLPRRLCAILPLSCLLFAKSWPQALVLAVPACYTAFVILRGKLELEYYEFRRFFLRSLAVVGGVYVAMQVWIFLMQIASEPITILHPSVTLRYGLVHLLCGIALQRQLRLGYASQSNRRQIFMLLSSAAVMILGFLLAEPLLRQGLGVALRQLLSLILIPFGLMLDLVRRLFALLPRSENDEKEYEEFTEYIGGILGNIEQIMGKPQEDPSAPTTIDATAIWAVLAGVFVLVAVVLLIRSFQKLKITGEPDEVVTRVTSVPKKKKTSAFSNRSKVRQLYRDFLRAEKGLGMKLMPNNTSQDVLDRIHPKTHRPSADDLRQVYLSARYDDRQSISRDQVERAKRALKGTRQSQ